MNIKIIAAVLLFSFPGGLFIASLVLALSNRKKGGNMKELINAIKALCSLVFAEEFSLADINVDDRANVLYVFGS